MVKSCGVLSGRQQGLKPVVFLSLSARLKSYPDTILFEETPTLTEKGYIIAASRTDD